MPPTPQSLFTYEEPPPPRADGILVIRPTAKRPLTKQERAFNRAVKTVQVLRGRLEQERHRLDAALVFHAAEVRPRVERAVALRTELVRTIAPFLDDRRLKQGGRTVLRSILIEQLDDILGYVDAPDSDLQTLFERLHGIGYGQAAQERIEEMRAEMAAIFDEVGLDLGVPELRAGMSEEEIASAAAQFAEAVRGGEQARRGDEQHRHKTKRELREEERERRYDQMRKDSIGVVYRRLVKALHPDLERDAGEREKKVRVMQEVTAAYARRDLHSLLRLELAWIEGTQAGAARLTDDKLRAYTELLKEQSAELAAEMRALRFHPRYALLIAEGPFGLPVLMDGPSEAARLDSVIDFVRAGIARLTSGDPLQEIRGAIEEYRQVKKARRKEESKSRSRAARG